MGEAAEFQHDEIRDLLPAYALGVLDVEEAAAVGAHLETCPSCRAALADYEQVNASLALAAPAVEPSPALKERLLANVRAEGEQRSEALPRPRSAPEMARQGIGARLAAAWTAFWARPGWQLVTVLLILALVAVNVWLWRQTALPPLPDNQLRLTGSDVAPEAFGILYVSANGRHGTLIVENMPPLAEGDKYQLWLIRDGERTSGGVFGVNEDGYYSIHVEAPDDLASYGAFGVTVEPEGGSPGPTGPRIIGYNL